jgi:hypothetical protein
MEKAKEDKTSQNIIVNNSAGTKEQKKIMKEFIDKDKLIIITDF